MSVVKGPTEVCWACSYPQHEIRMRWTARCRAAFVSGARGPPHLVSTFRRVPLQRLPLTIHVLTGGCNPSASWRDRCPQRGSWDPVGIYPMQIALRLVSGKRMSSRTASITRVRSIVPRFTAWRRRSSRRKDGARTIRSRASSCGSASHCPTPRSGPLPKARAIIRLPRDSRGRDCRTR